MAGAHPTEPRSSEPRRPHSRLALGRGSRLVAGIVLGTAGLVVVAMGAAADGDADLTFRATWALQLLLDVAWLLVVAGGALLVAAVVASLRNGGLTEDQLAELRARRRRRLAAAIMLIAAGGALIASDQVEPLDEEPLPDREGVQTWGDLPPGEAGGPSSDVEPVDPRLRLAVLAATALAIGGAVVAVARPWRDGAVEPAPAPTVSERLADRLDAPARSLGTIDDPRDAIVACYGAMLDALADAGMPRAASDPPLAYVRRILDALDGGEPAARLTDRFLRARFSQHPVDERDRAEAEAALEALRSRLAARTTARSEATVASHARRGDVSAAESGTVQPRR